MVNIVSRAGWGARAPRGITRTTWSARKGFTVHYSEGPSTQTPRQIQDFHMNSNGWSDVGYNFLVDKSGRVYEGRGWLVVGAHAAPHNTTHIGVCFIGYDGDATPAAKTSIRALYDEACEKSGRTLAKTYHGGLSGNSTDCPGKDLREWVKAGMPASGSQNSNGGNDLIGVREGDSGETVIAIQRLVRYAGGKLPKYGVDGQWGAETSAALLAVRHSVGSGVGSSKTMTGSAYAQLMRAVIRAEV